MNIKKMKTDGILYLITKPQNIENYGSFSINDFTVDDNFERMYVAINDFKKVVTIDLNNKLMLSSIGAFKKENYPNNSQTLFGFYYLYGIEVFQNKIIVADRDNSRIQYVHKDLLENQEIEIPYFGTNMIKEVVYKSDNIENNVLKYDINRYINDLPKRKVYIVGKV